MLIMFIIILAVLVSVADYSGDSVIEDGIITILLAAIITVVIAVLGALVGVVV